MTDRPATWWTREHPMLVAGALAEENGIDIARAMREASIALSVPADQHNLLLRRFDDEQLVDVAVQTTGDGKIYGAHPRRMLPAGLRAAGETPPVDDAGAAVFVTPAERASLEPILAAVRAAIDQEATNIDRDRLADIEAQLASLNAQMRSPSPRRRIVTEIFSTLRSLTENVVASAIWGGVFGG